MKFGDSNKKDKNSRGSRSPSFGGGPSLQTILDLQAQLAASQQQASSFATQTEVADAIAAREAAQAAADSAQDSAALAANAAQDAAAVAEEMNDATEEATTDAEQAEQDASINDNAVDIATLSGNIAALGASITVGQAAQDTQLAAQDTRLAAIEAQLPDDDSAIMARLDALEALPADDDSDLQAQVDEIRDLLRGNTWSITPATDGDLTRVFDWNTSTQNDILCNRYKVTTDPDSVDPLTELVVPDGETVTVYVIGVLAQTDGTPNNNVGGAEVELTNTGGVLSSVLIRQRFVSGMDWEGAAFTNLTQTNINVGAYTPENLAHTFTAIPGLVQDDDSELEARIAAIEAIGAMSYDDTQVQADIAALQAAPDNDTIYDDTALDARVAAVEAQLPDDDTALAQSIAANAAAIASEISDTDADVIALTASIAANATLAATNAAAASANSADIATLQGLSHDGAAQDARLDALEAPNYMLLDENQTVTGFNIFRFTQTFERQTLFGTPGAFGVLEYGPANNPDAFLVGNVGGAQVQFGDDVATFNELVAYDSSVVFEDSTPDNHLAPKGYVDEQDQAQRDRLDLLEAWLAAGLPGQVPSVPDPDGEPTWVYPYGHEFQFSEETTGITEATIDGSLPAGYHIGGELQSSELVGGTYEIDVSGIWALDIITSDILMELRVDGVRQGAVLRIEPKDSVGTPAADSPNAGTDQAIDFQMKRIVTLDSGDTPLVQLGFRPSVNGVEATIHRSIITIKRVSD